MKIIIQYRMIYYYILDYSLQNFNLWK